MNIKIGTLVLCHLLAPKAPTDQEGQQKVMKMPGVVREIIEKYEYQMIGTDYAVKRKTYTLIVEPEDKEKIFKIGIDACKPVVDESVHEEILKKKEKDKKAVENNSKDEDRFSKKEEKIDESNLPKEKKELLKALE